MSGAEVKTKIETFLDILDVVLKFVSYIATVSECRESHSDIYCSQTVRM